MPAMISTFVFLTVVFMVLSIYKFSIRNQEQVKQRVISLANKNQEDNFGAKNDSRKMEFKSFLHKIGSVFAAKSYSHKLESELSKADILLRGEEYIGMTILITIAGGLIGFVVFGGISQMLLLSFVGLMMPGFMVRRKKRARLNEINGQIGDALTVMTNSLRAGYSFQQALDLVSKEMSGPLAVEFRRTLREINLGNTTEQALLNLIQRVGSDDLELMLTAVLIQRQNGGNLAEIFDKISNSIRDRIRLKGEIKTLTAQGRMSGLMIGLLPVVIFFILLLISPDYIMVLLRQSSGRMILGLSIVSEIIGFMLINKIVDVEF